MTAGNDLERESGAFTATRRRFIKPQKVFLTAMIMLALATLGPVRAMHAGANAPQDAAPFFLPHDGDNYSLVPRITVDASNGTHVGYYTLSSGTNKVYYAYCATGCNQSTNWGAAVIGTTGNFGGDVQIAADPNGHPRMLWEYLPDASVAAEFKYAACDNGCVNAANWTVTTVISSGQFVQDTYGESQYFALDHLGRPRFIYHDLFVPAYYYAHCDTGCTSATNWSSTALNSQIYNSVWLAFTSANQPRVAYYSTSGTFGVPDHLAYLECNATCNVATNWPSPVEVYPIVSGYFANLGSQFSFHLSKLDQPRFLYYSGELGNGDPDNNTLFYAWCNSACTNAGNWGRSTTGVPAGNGDGPDVAFDNTNNPHIIYHNDSGGAPPFSLGYGTCTANCETTHPAWQQSFLDQPSAIPPVPPIPGCSQSFWYIRTSNALAMDSAGNPRAVYDADNVHGGTCTVTELLNLVRYATLTGLNNKTYVPRVMR